MVIGVPSAKLRVLPATGAPRNDPDITAHAPSNKTRACATPELTATECALAAKSWQAMGVRRWVILIGMAAEHPARLLAGLRLLGLAESAR